MGGQKKTLAQVFEEPTRSDISYDAAIALIKAHGGIVKDGAGSRVSIFIGGEILKFHRPHKKELPKYVVDAIRETLGNLGITPK